MALNDYHFMVGWYVEAPPDDVWALVADPRTYTDWWPEFKTVSRQNDIEGVGARVAADVKSFLPYHLRFRLESVRYDRPHVAEVRSAGDLEGMMRWLLVPYANGTYLVFEETVRTPARLMTLLAPVGRPFFKWNHARMMRHGHDGLRRALARAASASHSMPAR
ncbi:MAG: SRPBCC family protein [Dehalococcoidia bacterium]